MPTETPVHKVETLREFFATGATKPLPWRKGQLATLRQMIIENEGAIFASLASDLGKSQTESFATEVGLLLSEIRHAERHLKSWTKAKRIFPGLHNLPGTARIQSEPLGVVLIIAPWNYPLMLALAPLVGALAAGNCAVLKPSEMTPATSTLIAGLVPRYFSKNSVQVVEGGVEETTLLLKERFDHIFFTGSETVGKIIMRAASENLTPVTLELGGKSPCILTSSADIKTAARRVAWGKSLNAGQTCVAPDYILALPGTSQAFKEAFASQINKMFSNDIRNSPDYSRIVTTHQFDRLASLISEEHVTFGGEVDREQKFITPTLLENLPEDATALRDEIFGPILPIVEIPDLNAAIQYINARAKPLSLYLFSSDTTEHAAVIDQTSSGTVAINDVVMQFGTTSLPFGGVGNSGMGQSHGKASFDAFSHAKPVMRKPFWGEIKLRYAPYSALQERLFRQIFR